jgi:RNA 3'-terminal phosphate cyclase (ATP)
MLTLDGSLGDGGGQVLRAAVSLSAATGLAFRMTGVRAGREKPGLLRQHLTAVATAAKVCDAHLDGAAVGSKSFSFSPAGLRPGDYAFAIGSSGSAALILQVLLPALARARAPSTVVVEGGTHAPGCPPFDFLEKSLAPLLRRMGMNVELTLHRAGFQVVGGGRVSATVASATSFSPLHLLRHGATPRRRCTALVAGLPGEIAVRELELVKRMMDWPEDCFSIRQLPEDEGPGNVVTVEVGSEEVTEVFTACGRRGVSAESVAESALQQAKAYLAAAVPVGAHLAEHLLVPMALAAGGSFVTSQVSRCASGTMELIRLFLGAAVSVEPQGKDRYLLTVPTGTSISRVASAAGDGHHVGE